MYGMLSDDDDDDDGLKEFIKSMNMYKDIKGRYMDQ
jgi:hypothetical protein